MYITNAILGTVAHSKCSILIAEARLTIIDRLVSLSIIVALEGQSFKYSVNVLLTCILYCDSGPGGLLVFSIAERERRDC